MANDLNIFGNEDKFNIFVNSLDSLDFFLRRYLNEQVCKPLPSNLEEMKARINRGIKELPESLVRTAVFSMEKPELSQKMVSRKPVGAPRNPSFKDKR